MKKVLFLLSLLGLLSINLMFAQLQPPANLRGALDMDSGEVVLQWDGPGAWITQGTPTDTYGTAYGFTNEAVTEQIMIHRFNQANLTSLGIVGRKITSFYVFSQLASRELEIRIYTSTAVTTSGSTTTAANMQLVYSQMVTTNSPAASWVNVPLDTPYIIPSSGEILLGYRKSGNGYDMPVTGQTGGNTFNGLARNNAMTANTWTGLPGVLLFRAYVEDPDFDFVRENLADDSGFFLVGPESNGTFESNQDPLSMFAVDPNPLPQIANYASPNLGIILNPFDLNSLRSIIEGYKVYRNTTTLTASPITLKTYSDAEAPSGDQQYRVVSVYPGGEESAPVSVTVNVRFIRPANLTITQISGERRVEIAWPLIVIPPEQDAQLQTIELYKDGVLLSSLEPSATEYIDEDVYIGATYYYYSITKYSLNYSAQTSYTIFTLQGTIDPNDVPWAPVNATSSQTLLEEGAIVRLAWEEPQPDIPNYLSYTTAEVPADVVGWNNTSDLLGGQLIRFTVPYLQGSGLHQALLTSIRFYVEGGSNNLNVTSNWQVVVYQGGRVFPDTNPGTFITSVEIPNNQIYLENWNEVSFPTPVVINAGQELWFGYTLTIAANANPPFFWYAYDEGTNFQPMTNILKWGLTWEFGEELENANVLVGGVIEPVNGAPFLMSHNKLATEQYPVRTLTNSTLKNGRISMYSPREVLQRKAFLTEQRTNLLNTRAFEGYRIYKNGNLITESAITDLFYLDEAMPGSYTYTIYGDYGMTGLSSPLSIPVVVDNIPIFAEFPYQENFETIPPNAPALPTNWRTLKMGEGANGWIRLASSGYESPRSAVSVSRQSASTGYNVDNWLVSPRLRLPEVTAPQIISLEFMVGEMTDTTGEYFGDYYTTYISTSNFDPSDFVEIQAGKALTSTDWIRDQIDISEYAGELVFIAIRHHNSNNKGRMRVDDFTIDVTVSDIDTPIPQVVNALQANYPNPFNPETTIKYSVKTNTHVTLEIFNVKGQKVRTLVNGPVEAGNRQVIWNGIDDRGQGVASGVYFYRMKTDDYTATKRMMLIK